MGFGVCWFVWIGLSLVCVVVGWVVGFGWCDWFLSVCLGVVVLVTRVLLIVVLLLWWVFVVVGAVLLGVYGVVCLWFDGLLVLCLRVVC